MEAKHQKLLFPEISLIMVLNSVKNNNNKKYWWYYFGITGIKFIITLSFIYFYCMSFSLNSFNSSIYIMTTRQRQRVRRRDVDYLLSGLMETEQYL